MRAMGEVSRTRQTGRVSELDDAAQVQLLAAALRDDARDLSLYAGFMLTTLTSALPPEVVEVERHRSLAEKVRGAEGTVVGVTVRLEDRRWTLDRDRVGAAPQATVCHEVNGIVLSTDRLALDSWAAQVAAAVVRVAGATAGSGAALEQMLRPRGL